MKIGLIGYGHWGAGFVARNLARVFDLAVIVDPVPDRAVVASADWGAWGTRIATEPEVAFDKCDAVWIATPVSTHADVVRAALEAGVHVLCEKPFVLDADDAADLAALAEEKGLTLMVGFLSLFTGQYLKAWERVLELDAGTVTIDSRRLTDRPSRSDKSVLWGLGPHDVAAVVNMLGRPLESEWEGTEHRVTGRFVYAGGNEATFELDWLARERLRSTIVSTHSDTNHHRAVLETADAPDPVEPLLAEAQAFARLLRDPRGQESSQARALALAVTGELAVAQAMLEDAGVRAA